MSTTALWIADLYETLSDDDKEVVFEFMQRFVPYDDEPLSHEEVEAIRKGDEEYARGECISRDEYMRMYNLDEAV